MFRRILLLCLALLVVTGCESVFGKESGQRGSTPGKREQVFSADRALKADTELKTTGIEVPAPTDKTSWSLAGGGLERAKGNIAMSPTPAKAWSVSIGKGSEDKRQLIAEPVISDGKIYTIDTASHIMAMNVSDGSVLWQKDIPDPRSEDSEVAGAGLGYAGGKLVATTNFGNVVTLDAATGRILWQKTLPAPIRSAPMIDGDHVYVTSTVNVAYDMSMADGSINWTHAGVEEPAALMGMAGPMPYGEIVVVPYSSGQVVGVRKINGGIAWEENLAATRTTEGTLPAMSDIQGELSVDGDKLYVTSHSGRLAVIDVRSGQRVWETDGGGTNTPWVAGNMVYVLTIENQLAALSAEDGRVFWSVDLQRYVDPQDRTDPIVWTGPLLAGGKLWITNSLGEVHSYDPRNGKLMDSMSASSAVFVPMFAVNRTLYILSDDGTLTAYR